MLPSPHTRSRLTSTLAHLGLAVAFLSIPFLRWQPPSAEARPLSAATPSLSVALPASEFIGASFSFDVTFDNTGSNTGYGPFIDLVFPYNGADGAGNTDTPDGLDFTGADYLGASLTSTVLTFPGAGSGPTCVSHPYARDTSGNYLQVCGTPGDKLVVILLPFGSVTPTQPPMTVTVHASLSDLADLGTGLTLRSRAGFRFGQTPLDDWCCDAVIVSNANTNSSAWSGNSITPTLISVHKTYSGPEDETATGPNYPRTYTVSADIPAGQTITDLNLTDTLPDNLAYLSVSTAGTVVQEPPVGVASGPPNNQLTVNFASVVGTASSSDASMTVTFFAPRYDANADPVIDPSSGSAVTSADNASAVGTWTPLDTRDSSSPDNAVANPPGPEHTLNDRSLAVQKSVSIINDTGAPGASPGDTLQYTLDVQVSDYFTMGDLTVTDVISDGQHFDPTFTPTLSATERGTSTAGTFIDGTDLNVDTSQIGNDPNPSTDGTTTLTFDLSGALSRLAADGLLQGGRAVSPDAGPATATIVFRTQILDNFTDTYPSGDPSVDQGDVLNDFVTASGTVRENATPSIVHGTATDTSGAELTIERGTLAKSIYAVNGSTSFSSPPLVAPGDTVTYRIQQTLPTSDVENLTLTDYLPLPVFDATELASFQDVVDSTVPAAGFAKFGPADTFRSYSGIVPSVTNDSGANSVTFSFGNYDNPANQSTVVDLLFTVTMTDVPYADQLFLTNQVRGSEGSTNAGTSTDDQIVQIKSSEPLLKITKGVIATSNSADAYSPTTTGPVSFAAPGSSGTRWSGTIDSQGLESSPVDSNVSGVDAGDLVSFAIVVENLGSGHRGAHDIRIKDVIPPGFSIPSGGLNLTVTRGDGTSLSYNPLGSANDATDLFDQGIELVDPSADEGACQAYSLTNGRNIAVVTYDLELNPDVGPSQTISNTATVFNYASQEGGPDFTGTDSDLTDDASVTIAQPALSKSVVSTNQPFTAGRNVAIGEQAQYQLIVTIPEGQASPTTLVDTLDPGLAFVSLDSLTASPGLSTSVGTFDDVRTNVVISAPGGSGTAVDQGRQMTLDFGTLTNSNRDNTTPETLTLTYTAVVVNGGSNDRGDTRTNHASLNWTVNGSSTSATASAPSLTIVEPTLQVIKQATPNTGDADDIITFTVTVSHTASSNAEAFDLGLSDTLPTDMTYVAGSLSSTGGVIPDTLGESGGTISASWSALDLGSNSQFQFQAQLNRSVSPGQQIINTANLTWTSLPGVVTTPQTPNNGLSTERTGDTANPGGTDNDYRSSGSATVTVFQTPTKSIIATSESSTGSVGGVERVAIGEIIRFRLAFRLAEGTASNFQLQDRLPPGLRFLNDGTAKVALVSDSGIDSSTLSGSGLEVTGDETTVASITPTFILPDTAVSASATTNNDTYQSGTDPYFKLGDLTNNDDDPNQEFVVVEFNALVENVSGNQAVVNATGAASPTTLTDDFRSRIGGTFTSTSNQISVRVAEPNLSSFAKSVNVTSPDAGDTVVYTLGFTNASGNDSAPAFDLRLTDTLDSDLIFQSVSVTAPGYATVTDNSSAPTVDIGISELDPGDSVTVHVTAVIVDDAIIGETIPNSANVTFTSLPGNSGTTSNPTGSSTPGGAGTATGERTGSDGMGGVLNDYANIATRDLVLADPAISKSVYGTSVSTTGDGEFNPAITDLVIGEEVTFRITVTLPEGDGPVTVTDNLPTPPNGVLRLLSSRVVSIGGQISGSALSVGDAGTASDTGSDGLDDQAVFSFGSLHNEPDGVSNSGDQIVIEVVARDENVSGNQNGDSLVNQAVVDAGDGSQSASSTAEIVEPALSVTKTADDTAPHLGQTVTYTVTVSHTGTSTADAQDIRIEDVLPTGLSYVSASASLPAAQVDDSGLPTLVFTIPTLSLADGSLSFTYQATVDSAATSVGQTLTNLETMTWTSISGSDANERTGEGGVNDYAGSTSETVTVTGIDLTLSKDDGGVSAQPGDTITYSLSVANVGNTDATGVIIHETVPESTTFNDGSSTAGWSCTNGGAAGAACTFALAGSLAPNTPQTVDFAVDVDNPAPAGLNQIDNTANVDDDGLNGAEPTPENNTDSEVTPIGAVPDLNITKDDGLDTTIAGTALSYSMVVGNGGDQDATGVTVTDTVPDHATFVPGGSTSGWTCTPDNEAGSICTFDIGPLDAGASRSLTFELLLDDPIPTSVREITNTATVTDDGTNGPEPTPKDNTASDTDHLISLAGDDLTKDLVDTSQSFSTGNDAAIGEILTYQVNFTVPAGSMVDVTMTDVLERGLAFVDCQSISASSSGLTTSQGTFADICDNPTVLAEPDGSSDPQDAGRRIVFSFGTLTNSDTSDATLTVSYRAVVLDSAGNVRGGSLSNRVGWTWTGGSLVASAEDVRLIEPGLILKKSASPSVLPPGGTIHFTLTIGHTSASDADAFDLVLSDELPPALTYVSGSLVWSGTGLAPDRLDDSAAPILSVGWDEFPLGSTSQIGFDAVLGDVDHGARITNRANLEWTSLPGDVSSPQSTFNDLSVERRFDPLSSVDVYRVGSAVTIRTPSLPATGFAPGVVTERPPQLAASAYDDMAPLRLSIPKLRVSLPVTGIPLTANGWDLTWLTDQAGYLDGTAYPTHPGNTALTGHVYLADGLPGPFYHLAELQWGDEIRLTSGTHVYVYQVRRVQHVDPNDLSALSHETLDWVTLITCEAYDPGAGDYARRLAVSAVLVRVE